MSKYVKLLTLAALTGCGSVNLEKAARVANYAKIGVDGLADGWEGFVQAKIAECREKNLPTEEAREECLGPVHDAGPAVEAAFRAVHAAQLALYLILIEGGDPATVAAASADLSWKVRELHRHLRDAGFTGGV